MSPVGAKEAHTDGTRIVQYHSDDQNSMMTTIMQMPMDFLEIPEPSLPRGFLELAEEAKHVDVGSGQSCYTEEVQSQDAGLTRPVLVTIIVQFACTEGGSYDSSRYLYREYTTYFFPLGTATQWTSWA